MAYGNFLFVPLLFLELRGLVRPPLAKNNSIFFAVGSSHSKNIRLLQYQAQLEPAWRNRECDAVFPERR